MNFLIGIGVLGGSTLAWLLGIPHGIIWIFAGATLVGGIEKLYRSGLPALLLLLLVVPGCRDENFGGDFRQMYGLYQTGVARYAADSEDPDWSIRLSDPESVTRRSFVHDRLEIRVFIENNGDAGLYTQRHIDGEIVTDRAGFWILLINLREQPIRVDWNAARYQDEEGEDHELVSCNPDQFHVRIEEAHLEEIAERSVRRHLFPKEKKHHGARDCGDIFYGAPILPWNAQSDASAELRRISEQSIPVQLIVPIEIDGTWYEYRFSFILVERDPRAA